MHHTPFFSVIIPTYNRSKILIRSVKSVLRQSYKNFEIVIVNDGSLEPYTEVLDVIQKCSSSNTVKFVNNRTNMGAAFSRNKGVNNSTGEYIAFLDDDDEYRENFLSQCYNIINRTNPKPFYMWSSVKYYDYGAASNIVKKTGRIFSNSYSNTEYFLADLCSIGIGHGFVISKKCFNMIDGFDENLVTVEDTELFLRLIERKFKGAVNEEIGVNIHRHNSSKLTSTINNNKRILECKELLLKFNHIFNEYPTIRTNLLGHIDNLINKRNEKM